MIAFLLTWLFGTLALTFGPTADLFGLLAGVCFLWFMLTLESVPGDDPDYPKHMSTRYDDVDLTRWSTFNGAMHDPNSDVTLEKDIHGNWYLSDDHGQDGYSDRYGSYEIHR